MAFKFLTLKEGYSSLLLTNCSISNTDLPIHRLFQPEKRKKKNGMADEMMNHQNEFQTIEHTQAKTEKNYCYTIKIPTKFIIMVCLQLSTTQYK